jgi:RHS repeat-associated protein
MGIHHGLRGGARLGLVLVALGLVHGAAGQAVKETVPDEALVGADFRFHSDRALDGKRPVVELGTGMNYWDGRKWAPSEATFALAPDAFVADRMNFRVRLEANLNTVGGVTVVTPEGTVLRSSPIGLGLYDPVTGESLVIASVADCEGVQVADNTVVYENAFAGVCANVVYHVEAASFEQDVVLTGKLDPAAYGFDPETAQLQIFTEFYGAPEPERVRRPLRVERDPAVRQRRANPDLIDEVLGFDQFVLGTGRAFTALSSGESGVAVAKSFEEAEGRTVLVETLDYALLRKEFEALPDCVDPTDRAALGPKRVSGYAGLPRAGSGKQARATPVKTAPRRDFAQAGKTPGVVVDYLATIGGTLSSSTTFRGDTTYFLSSAVICNGAATIEGGAVFKYPTNSTSYLKLNSTVTCRTSPYRPAVFTAADDDTVGDAITTGIWSGYTGTIRTNGYGNPALWLYYTSPNLANLRFRHAQEAIRFEGVTGSLGTLGHSQLVDCIRGIVVNGSGSGSGGGGATLTVDNTLLAGVQYPISINNGSFSGNWFHCTVDTATRLVTATASTTVRATNSVFANLGALTSGGVSLVGNNNGFYAATGFGTAQVSSGTYPFQTVGAGNHYLSADSAFRDLGTTNGVGSTLLADLRRRTTYPPLLLINAITTNTTLVPRAPRDTGPPDLGYHYDPLDYAVDNLSVTNATLTLAEGVALATYGSNGIVLRDHGQLHSAGTPGAHNHFVRYYNVQEQATNWGGATPATTVSLSPYSTGAAPPSAQLRFTDFDGLAGGGFHLYTQSNGWKFASLQVKDCTLNSGLFILAGPSTSSLSLSNNLFEWISLSCSNSPKIDAYNNLFRYGTNTLVNAGGAWTFKDNAYDLSVVDASGTSITADHNAYITTNITVTGRFSPTNAADVVLTSFTYATGPFGAYYHSSTNLDDKGSRTAAAAGLFPYTAKTSGVTETNTTVDIGFHYVPVATYRASEGFSASLSLHPWSYRYTEARLGLSSLGMTYWNGTWWRHSTDANCIVASDFQHPGADNDSVRVFHAPFSGRVLITGSLRNFDSGGAICGDGIEYRLLQNTNTIKDWQAVYRSATWNSVSVEAQVQAGDLLQSQVSSLTGNNSCDTTQWDPLISYPDRAIDTDGDGIPDYLEDANGNGAVDPGETAFDLADTDFDGMSDAEELDNGTDPLDAASTFPMLLSSFSFNTTNWIGDQGQIPIFHTGLAMEPGIEGGGVVVTGADYAKRLNYRYVEPDGKPNFAFKSGTVSFWFKPNWASTNAGGTGPNPAEVGRYFNFGEWSSPVTRGFWSLFLSSGGSKIGWNVHTNGTAISTSGAPTVSLSSNVWHHFVLAYSPSNTANYVDGVLAGTGSGITHIIPDKADRDLGFYVGTDTYGAQGSQATFDQLKLYNYPLDAASVSNLYATGVYLAHPDDDTDFDGRKNSDELADGTDPGDPNSVLPMKLASFRFNTTNWIGDQGQLPVGSSNIVPRLGIEGRAAGLVGTNLFQDFLAYRQVETNGNPNINLRNGTVSVWFRPSWSSTNVGGLGPSGIGEYSRLFATSRWGSSTDHFEWQTIFNPLGTALVAYGSKTTNSGTASWSTGWAAINWASNSWHRVDLAYSPSNSALYIDGALATSGSGIPWTGDIRDTQVNFVVGADVVQHERANGTFDLLQTYNYPLSADEIRAIDSDGDGVSDFQERADGTDPGNPASFTRRLLASWYFDTNFYSTVNQAYDPNPAPYFTSLTNTLGDQGQVPVALSGVQTGTNTFPVRLLDMVTNNPVLRYAATQTNGAWNVSPTAGTLIVWVKPEWLYLGPQAFRGGTEGVLAGFGSVTNPAGFWGLTVSTNRNAVGFTAGATSLSGGASVLLSTNVRWSQVAVTWSAERTTLHVNGSLVATGGVARLPQSLLSQGLNFGSDRQGKGVVDGALDFIESHNYAMSPFEVQQAYFRVRAIDSDLDGISDIEEDRLHFNAHKWDMDGDGIPDGWEFAHGLDPRTMNTNDLAAYLGGFDPRDPGEYETVLPFDWVGTSNRVVSIGFYTNDVSTTATGLVLFAHNSASAPTNEIYNLLEPDHDWRGQEIDAGEYWHWQFVHYFPPSTGTNYSATNTFGGLALTNSAGAPSALRVYAYAPASMSGWYRGSIFQTYLNHVSEEVGLGPWLWADRSYSWPAYLDVRVRAYPPGLGSRYLESLPYSRSGTWTATGQDGGQASGTVWGRIQGDGVFAVGGLTPGTRYRLYLSGGTHDYKDVPRQISVGASSGSVGSGLSTINDPLLEGVRIEAVTERRDHVRYSFTTSSNAPTTLTFKGAKVGGFQLAEMLDLPPITVTASATTQGVVHVTWKQTATNSVLVPGADGFRVFWRLAPADPWFPLVETRYQHFVDSQPVSQVTNYYRVVATNEFGSVTNFANAVPPIQRTGNWRPSLPLEQVILGPAVEGRDYEVFLVDLIRRSRAWDSDGDTLRFLVEPLMGATGSWHLTNSPSVLATLGTNSALTNLFGPGSHLTWTPPADSTGSIQPAFRVRAYDGKLLSDETADVYVRVAPESKIFGWGPTYLVGAPWNSTMAATNANDLGAREKGFTSDLTPVDLPDTRQIILPGASSTRYAIDARGKLHAWGGFAGNYGDLGAAYLLDPAASSSLDDNVLAPPAVLGWPQSFSDFSANVGTWSGPVSSLAALGDGTVVKQGLQYDNPLSDQQYNPLWGSGGIDFDQIFRSNPIFTPVSGLSSIVKVATHRGSHAALDANGNVFGWGWFARYSWDWIGGVTNGSETPYIVWDTLSASPQDHDQPVKLDFPGHGRALDIANGGFGWFLALLEDGSVWQWGNRTTYGGVPDGSVHAPFLTPGYPGYLAQTNFFKTPVAFFGLTNVAQIVSPELGSCAAFLKKDGTVWVWGSLGRYQIPGQIPGLANIKEIGFDGYTLVAIDGEGRTTAFGLTHFYQSFTQAHYVGAFPGMKPFEDDTRNEGGSHVSAQAWSLEEPVELPVGREVSRVWLQGGGLSGGYMEIAVGSRQVAGLSARGGDQRVHLQWSLVPGASSYQIQRSLSLTNGYTVVGNASSSAFDDRTVVNGTTYFYRVAAVLDGQAQTPSAPAWTTPVAPPPLPVVTATDSLTVALCHEIILTITNGGDATAYVVFRSASSGGPFVRLGTVAASGAATYYVDQPVDPAATTFYYRVQAVNGSGQSTLTDPVKGESLNCSWISLDPPTGLSVVSTNVGRIVVSWDSVIGADGYVVYLKPNFRSDYRVAATLTANETEVALTALAGYRYDVLVATIQNGAGESATVGTSVRVLSDLISHGVVTGLAANPGNQQMHLTWDDAPMADSYQLFVRKVGSANWLPSGAAYGTFQDTRSWATNLTNGVSYEFKVQASLYGGGTLTNSVVASPESMTPQTNYSIGLFAIPSDDRVDLFWTNSALLTDYTYLVLRADGANPYLEQSVEGAANYYRDDDVHNGQTYHYYVLGLDTNHHRVWSQTVTATPGLALTNQFTLVGTPANGAADLTWTPRAYATDYVLRQSTFPGDAGSILATFDAGTTNYLHLGVANGAPRYYTAQTRINGVVVETSPQVPVVPSEFAAPLQPASIAAVVTASGIHLSWTPRASSASYQLTRNGGNTRNLGTTAYLDAAGLTDGAVYTYAVRARNLAGDLSASQTVVVTNTFAASFGVTNQTGGVSTNLADYGTVHLEGVTNNAVLVVPTNLLLSATLTLTGTNASQVVRMDFYSDDTLLGSSVLPPHRLLWRNVPSTSAGRTNLLRVVATFADAAVVASAPVPIQVKWDQQLNFFRTGASDLQLPVVGPSLALSRGYSSQGATSSIPSALGRGWTAGWLDAHAEIEGDLATGWTAIQVPGGVTDLIQTIFAYGGNLPSDFKTDALQPYQAVESAQHLVRLLLPDGQTVTFAPRLHFSGMDNPAYYPGSVRVVFDPVDGTYGELGVFSAGHDLYATTPNLVWEGALTVANSSSSLDGPLTPDHVTYTSPEGLVYFFNAPAPTGDGRLQSITDPNGNVQTYSYATSAAGYTLSSITNSAGRGVYLSYTVSAALTNIVVRDPIAQTNLANPAPLIYSVSNSFLVSVQKLLTRTNSLYETNRYAYSASGLLNAVFDPRGFMVLSNIYSGDRLASQTDASGATVSFLVTNTAFSVTTTVDVNGVTESETALMDASGRPAAVQTAAGTQSFDYDNRGRLDSQTDVSGGTTQYAYNSRDQLTGQTDPLGHTTTTQVNAAGQPTYVGDARGAQSSFAYDSLGNLKSSTQGSVVTTNAYDERGLLTVEVQRASDGLSLTNLSAYSPVGDLIGSVDTMGFAVTNAYDLNGNRTNETRFRTVGGSPETITTTYVYDAQNRLVATLDPYGYTNRTIYGRSGKVEQSVDPIGRSSLSFYDPRGMLVQSVGPDGAVGRTVFDAKGRVVFSQQRHIPSGTPTNTSTTTYLSTWTRYDAAGRATNVAQVANLSVLFTNVSGRYTIGATTNGLVVLSSTATVYGSDGRVAETVDARGTRTGYAYDAAGRRVAVTNAVGTALETVTGYAYDENGNQTLMTDGLGRVTETRYDLQNRPDTVVLPAIAGVYAFRSTVYDALGRRVEEIAEDGVTNAFGYDLLGRLTAVTNDFTGTNQVATAYGYDELGNQTSQTDANGHTTIYSYDRLGRRFQRTLPDNATYELSSYDPAGQMLKHTNFNGVVVTNRYDLGGRLLGRWFGSTNLESYLYDFAGRRTNRVDESGTWNWFYDANGRLWTNSGPVGAITYGYDSIGVLTNLQSSATGGARMGYSYDALGRLTGVGGTVTAAYGYDRVGSLAQVSYGGGVATNLYQYDARQRLTNVLWMAGSTNLGHFGYGVNAVGLRTSLVETLGAGPERTFNYAYDRLHRLLGEQQMGTTIANTLADSFYDYDLVGNRTNSVSTLYNGSSARVTNLWSVAASLDADDHLKAYTDNLAGPGTVNLLYDKAGNTRTNGADVFLYDWADRLTNAVVGTKTVRLRYNADGQRVSKVVVVGGVGTTNLYLVDDRNPTGYSQVIEERSVTTGNVTNLVASYGYGLDSLGQKRGTVTNYFLFDGHGSVRALVNGASAGTQVDTYDYDAWGVQIATTGTTLNNYRYAGEEWDADLGLYYNRARYYLPKTGRFLSMDSYEGNTSDPASLHKYLYCQGDPFNRIDPSGHDGEIGSQITTIGGIGQLASQAYGAVSAAYLHAGIALAPVIQGASTTLFWAEAAATTIGAAGVIVPGVLNLGADLATRITSSYANNQVSIPTAPGGRLGYGFTIEDIGGRQLEQMGGKYVGGNVKGIDGTIGFGQGNILVQFKAHDLGEDTLLQRIGYGMRNLAALDADEIRGTTGNGTSYRLPPGPIEGRIFVVAVPQNLVRYINSSQFISGLRALAQETETLPIVRVVGNWTGRTR